MQATFKFTTAANFFEFENGIKIVEVVKKNNVNLTFISALMAKDEAKAFLQDEHEFFLSKQETTFDGKIAVEFRQVTKQGKSITELLK